MLHTHTKRKPGGRSPAFLPPVGHHARAELSPIPFVTHHATRAPLSENRDPRYRSTNVFIFESTRTPRGAAVGKIYHEHDIPEGGSLASDPTASSEVMDRLSVRRLTRFFHSHTEHRTPNTEHGTPNTEHPTFPHGRDWYHLWRPCRYTSQTSTSRPSPTPASLPS
jgi:hypothetical protein